jgi:serine/threonine protein phosphatase PrpC
LCSDGLTDALSDIEIESILNVNNDFKTQGQALIDAAIKRNEGYGDNITVVLIEFKQGERNAR